MSTDAPPTPAGTVPELRPRSRQRMARPVATRNPQWYRITDKADPDVALIDIYDEIGWFGITAADFVKDLREVTAPRIELHINSPGGDVFDAVAIYNSLRQHAATVHVVIDSLAASAASFIAMAGDRITATANAMLMIHDAMGLVVGNADDMREMAGLLDKHSDNIASIYAARTSADKATWRARMGEEHWYNADEALEVGLVDEVQSDAGRPASDSWDLSVFGTASPSVTATAAPAEAEPDADPEPPASPEPETATAPPAPPAPAANGDRRHLGETASWYLPRPQGKEQEQWMR